MTHPHDLSLTPLARRALLTLHGGEGKAVGVFSGRVWITEEGALDDHVLGPGDSMALRRPGLVLVEGLQDSQLILFDSEASAACPDAARSNGGHAQGVAAVPAPSGLAGIAGIADEARPSVAEHERIARELRRRARAHAITWLLRALGRLLTSTISSPIPSSTSPPPALPRPGGPALAGRMPR
jgi:hypothetical protein